MKIFDFYDISEARRELAKAQKPRIVLMKDIDLNRALIERADFEVILFSNNARIDNIRYFDSGINRVIADFAFKRKISFGFDLNEIRLIGDYNKGIALARVSFAIEICRKSGVRFCVMGARDERGARALLVSLGASSKQAKEALVF